MVEIKLTGSMPPELGRNGAEKESLCLGVRKRYRRSKEVLKKSIEREALGEIVVLENRSNFSISYLNFTFHTFQ